MIRAKRYKPKTLHHERPVTVELVRFSNSRDHPTTQQVSMPAMAKNSPSRRQFTIPIPHLLLA
jgi:hypothetical protein